MLNFQERRYRQPFLAPLLLLLLYSCTTLRNYPANKPFVYQTNIELEGKFSKEESKQLTADLTQQLDDSIQVRSVSKLVGWKNGPRLFYTEIVNPPVYDSANAAQSVQFMRALLNAKGYFRDSISFDTVQQIKEDQYRTTINFKVLPGKLIALDSVRYNMGDDSLQQITINSLAASQLKKGTAFSKAVISAELDRLVNVYRNNGYMRFSFENLLAVYDTVGVALLRPTFDPIEQARQLEALRQRRENPTADLEIRLRPSEDSAHLIRYHVGNITIYPDLSVDTGRFVSTVDTVRGITVINYRNLFKPHIVTENIYLRQGRLYNRNTYLRTLNRLNSIGAWRLVSIDQNPRTGTDTVDFVVKMVPALKYQSSINLEGTQNRGNPFVGQYGLGITAGINNRNMGRAANQASTNIRYGVELGERNNIQTQVISINNTIVFPRLMPHFRFIPENRRDNFRTLLNLSLNNTDRFEFFNLYAFNLSWGYEYTWRNKQLNLRLPNLEYTIINKRQLLLDLEKENASYKYIFNDGLVASTSLGYTVTGGNKVVSNQKRINLEASGMLTGLAKSAFIDSNLYRFVRLDAEFRQTHKLGKSAFAWRFFGGAGFGIPLFDGDNRNRYLPFFKQYIAGGPNSMRAWALRKLGPGSNNKSTAQNIAPDRFGDLQLEANAEYRFPLANIGGVLLNGAAFTDIGNIWFIRNNPDFTNGNLKLSRLWTDLAIGSGLGMRIDFGFFLVRFDYAYKIKDPSKRGSDIWLYNWKPLNGQLQFGINYPF
ncbi:Outer membrane protein assembly factor BamA [Cnuella takakiae]|uniref:Outer membrane protein assembly factor BamA n=1 Tax=Cnuella takakiae TaxID=1302690 RepID=A0A1M4YC46_9BACT|nr:BamA/TamA family outer membrane protein [Cnuella takakiae]OLY93106.1 hypothetical protein BUE76_15305 [Cnuella takakiae]SHF03239.1 Outer membrane protein assembly factor BamA [Cnuella takakiae]